MRFFARWLAALLVCVSTGALAQQAVFDGGTGVLTVPALKVSAAAYTNVLLGLINPADDGFTLRAATLQQPTCDVASAWRNLLTGTNSWALNSTGSDGAGYELTFSTKPGPTLAFPYAGASGARAEWTLAGKVNGVPDPVDINHLFFTATTYGLSGLHNLTEGTCSSATGGPPLPTAALLGASGAFYNRSDYVACTPSSALDSTSTVT